MDYNETSLDIKYALINVFLTQNDRNVLDISYSVNRKVINIQLILLEHSLLKSLYIDRLNNELAGYIINLTKIYISRDEYNSNRDNWNPVAYNWLEDVLLSKLEI